MIFRFITKPSQILFNLGLIFLALFCHSSILMAQPLDAEKPSGPETAELVDIAKWQFGLAVGIGKRTSVVYQQDDIPLYLIPSIRYYDDHLFFDNGTLGYTLFEDRDFAFSVVTELNPLAAQFYDYHPENVLFDNALSGEAAAPVTDEENFDSGEHSGDAVTDADGEGNQAENPTPDDDGPTQQPEQPEQPVQKDIEDVKLNQPRWSLDAGLQLNWFINQNQSLVAQVFTDASNLHNGQRYELLWSYGLNFAKFDWAQGQELSRWRAQVRIGLNYLTKTTSQYYYGIDERHLSTGEIGYQAEASVNPVFSITATRPITERLKVLLFYKQQKLDSSISQSPKITDSGLTTYFAGVIYEF